MNAITKLEEKFSDGFDKDFKTPKTRNNYKGDEILPITIPGTEIAKAALVSSAFKSKPAALIKRRSSVMTPAVIGKQNNPFEGVRKEDPLRIDMDVSEDAVTAPNTVDSEKFIQDEADKLAVAEAVARVEAKLKADEDADAEEERERLEEEALIASVQKHLLLYPTAGYVLKSVCANGNKLFVNVCKSFSVSDVVSTQGIQGCPYMILYAANPSIIGIQDTNVQVYHAVMHPKYIFAAVEDTVGKKLKVCLLSLICACFLLYSYQSLLLFML